MLKDSPVRQAALTTILKKAKKEIYFAEKSV